VNDRLRGEEFIPTHDQRLRVFISSSMTELAEERQAVARAISTLKLTPVLFELGARPHPPRAVYRAYLAQSDIFIGLYWQSYGHVAPGMQVSGLEEEFELSQRLPRLMYVKAPAPGREPRLADLISRIGRDTSYRVFRTPRELNRLVRDDLAALLSERFAAVRASAGASSSSASEPRPGRRPLPAGTTSLVGRDRDISELTALVKRNETRLVTLTGPGGVGKTRLAMAVGEQLRDSFGAGAVFVELAPVTEAERVLAGVAFAVGADLAATGSPLDALIEHFGGDPWLLILDNLEQVASVAPDLEAILERCRGLVIVATSRVALGLRAEWEYPVAPLLLAADLESGPVEELAASPAVALFVDRARAVHPDFVLTEQNAPAILEICRRLEGLPLAIELAAARTRLLQPDALLARLAASLDALGTGAVDMPERQRTLRATVEWSVGLLNEAERSLLEISAIFVGGWTISAAAQVAGLAEDHALALSEALARHSLIEFDNTMGEPRGRMLETIREFIAERLAVRPDAAELRHRHADAYRALVEEADAQLRSGRHSEWLDCLDAEAGNLGAAVRWYLASDPVPLPHLFRVLWPLWFLRDFIGDGRSWVAQLLPAAESLDHQSQADLQWTALVSALEVGDDSTALAARQRLEPLLAEINDRFLTAIGQLAIAWSSPITGDFNGALKAASSSLGTLRGQDEQFWTALALGSLGGLEIAVGHYDQAQRHLQEARTLGDLFSSSFLSAWSRAMLSAVSVARGRLDEAQAILDEAVERTLAASGTRSVALLIAAYAQLALAEGDPKRAAVLAGAANGIRQRAGLQPWPISRQAEADLVAEVSQALGTDLFSQIFAEGEQLSRHDAMAEIRDWRPALTQAS
jgi:predicted ATPase